jgi:outer membrane receptor protein involved in Fe transport
MKKIIYLFFVFATMISYSEALGSEYEDSAADDKEGVIRGVIIDSKTGQPMEYANVAIYNTSDSTLLTGGITNEKGEFEIRGMNYGDYYLEANFIGFNKSEVLSVSLDKENRAFDSGEIKLSPSTLALGTVDVVADKAAIEYKLDKKVVNVSQVVGAAGGSAVDALATAPSVQVDIEGNVTLRGSGSFTVLIDGRPSVLSGSDALRQIPASALENIEIITNPSAKYEPDGNSGIINLVTKKNSMNGFSGIVNGSIGTKDKYRGDFTLNYRTEKWNATIGADWRDETNYGNMSIYRETIQNDTTTVLKMDGDRDYIRGGQNFKAGVEYFLSDKTTISIMGEAGKSNGSRGGKGYMHEYTIPTSEDIYSATNEISARENDFYSATLNFLHNFDSEGHKLEAMAFYSKEDGVDEESEEEYLSDEDYNPTDIYLSRTSTLEGEDEQEFRIKADYTLPIGENSRLEAGYLGRFDKEIEDIQFQDYDTESGEWIDNEYFSSTTDFKRNVNAIYSTYSNQFGDFSFMAGLRGELTDREIYSSGVDSTYALNRFDVFPTLHLSYDFDDKNELMLSYSRRINRPSGRDLDPVPNYYNRYTIRLGNPELKPEYTDSYELGYMLKFGRSYLSFEAFRRVTHNKIERYETLGDDGIFYLRQDNFDRDFSTGLELMGNVEFTKWLMVNASISTFQYRINGELNGETIDRESNNLSGRLNATFKFTSNSRLQFQGFYRGPSTSIQGETKAMFFSDVSYRHDFFQKKLTATLSLRDPFGTGKFERESSGEDFYSTFKWEREPRVVMLTLSYKINNFKGNDRGDRS